MRDDKASEIICCNHNEDFNTGLILNKFFRMQKKIFEMLTEKIFELQNK